MWSDLVGVTLPPWPAALCMSSLHDVKQHIVHEMLPRRAFKKGAIFLNYLCLVYGPNDYRYYEEMQILPVHFEWCDISMWFVTNEQTAALTWLLVCLTFRLCEINPSKMETHIPQLIKRFWPEQTNYRTENTFKGPLLCQIFFTSVFSQ